MSSSSTEESLGSSILEPTTDPTNSLTSTTILNWIHTIHTPPQTLDHLDGGQSSPSHTLKRRHSSDTVPPEFLGSTSSTHKKRKPLEAMTDNGEAQGSGQSPTALGKRKAVTEGDAVRGAGAKYATPPKRAPAQRKPTLPSEIGVQMTDHGLLYEDYETFERYDHFVEKINAIVFGERWSTMKPDSAKRFRAYHTYYRSVNEATFVGNVFPLIMKNGYHKLTHSEDYNADGMAKDRQTYVDFLSGEKIASAMNRDFRRTLVPSRFSKDIGFLKQMSKELEKSPGMENPRPDYVFGHKIDRMPRLGVKMPQEVTDFLELVPGMHNAFLVVEAKADSGSVAEAENQLRRAGATLVNGARQLKSNVGDQLIRHGPDDATFVFGATFSPEALSIYVHWYDATSDLYHMNLIVSYAIRTAKPLEDSRKSMHNILQWGANDRFFEQVSLRNQIARYAERLDKEMRAKGRSKGTSSATRTSEEVVELEE